MSLRRWFVVLMSLLAVAAMTMPAAANGTNVEVVAGGLDNPRGITMAPNGALYVAEAGVGAGVVDPGDIDSLCFTGPEGPNCPGLTGAFTRIYKGEVRRLVTGLPSFADPEGGRAIGPSDVATLGSANLFLLIGGSTASELRDLLGPGFEAMGTLTRTHPDKLHMHPAGDIAAYEEAVNPDGHEELDSNANSVAVFGSKRYVADAGGNAILEIDHRGNISTLAVLPDVLAPAPPFLGLPPGTMIPMQAVPTGIVVGPDRALYVSQLTGFPFQPGAAKVYRVDRHTGDVSVYAEGFTNIIDLGFDRRGTLYVLEIATNSLLGPPGGALWAVNGGSHSMVLGPDTLFFPGGMTVGNDGDVYLTNCGVCPGAGQVLRVDTNPRVRR